MHRSGSILPILCHPNLVERVGIILVRHQLLVWHNQRIIEIRKIQAGQSLIFDIRGATAITRRRISPEVVVFLILRMFGIGSRLKETPGT